MMFKNGHEDALNAIEREALNSARIALNAADYTPMKDAIAQAIAAAVATGIQTMLEQQYSHEDFERDLNLKT